MKKAVFLDRDGVLNFERGEHTWLLEDFELLPGVVEGLQALKQVGYLLIIISNQSGIAKGLYNFDDVETAHDFMVDELRKSAVELDEIYYCPHHDKVGKCLCRKPGSLMLEKAIARFDVDVSRSVFIGDKPRDIEAGERVGVKGVLVEPNLNLLETVNEYILKG